jgi:hypothetical protein
MRPRLPPCAFGGRRNGIPSPCTGLDRPPHAVEVDGRALEEHLAGGIRVPRPSVPSRSTRSHSGSGRSIPRRRTCTRRLKWFDIVARRFVVGVKSVTAGASLLLASAAESEITRAASSVARSLHRSKSSSRRAGTGTAATRHRERSATPERGPLVPGEGVSERAARPIVDRCPSLLRRRTDPDTHPWAAVALVAAGGGWSSSAERRHRASRCRTRPLPGYGT